MNLRSKTGWVTLAVGFALFIPSSIGILVSNVPTVLCPFPLLISLPAMFLGGLNSWKVVITLPTLFFFVWQPGLFDGQAKIPKRSYWLFAVAAVLSVIYFISSWKWGLEYQGVEFTHSVCIINIVCVVFLGLALAVNRRRAPSYGFNLFLQWVLFAWLAWYAFPYLGELP
jgi:TRAP-type uncharacterized transport system fused permease subunit